MSAASSVQIAPRPEAERRAEAVAILRCALLCHDRARLDLDRASDALAAALDNVQQAIATYERVGEMVADASRHLARMRDEAGL